jgi:hypothetical protein
VIAVYGESRRIGGEEAIDGDADGELVGLGKAGVKGAVGVFDGFGAADAGVGGLPLNGCIAEDAIETAAAGDNLIVGDGGAGGGVDDGTVEDRFADEGDFVFLAELEGDGGGGFEALGGDVGCKLVGRGHVPVEGAIGVGGDGGVNGLGTSKCGEVDDGGADGVAGFVEGAAGEGLRFGEVDDQGHRLLGDSELLDDGWEFFGKEGEGGIGVGEDADLEFAVVIGGEVVAEIRRDAVHAVAIEDLGGGGFAVGGADLDVDGGAAGEFDGKGLGVKGGEVCDLAGGSQGGR